MSSVPQDMPSMRLLQGQEHLPPELQEHFAFQWGKFAQALSLADMLAGSTGQPKASAQVDAWDESTRTECIRVWSASDYVAESFCKQPLILDQLQTRLHTHLSLADYQAWLAELLAKCVTEDDLHKALRRFRRLAMVRLIWRDVLGQADMWQTAGELTHLADTCVHSALTWLYDFYTPKWGTPIGKDSNQAQQMVVIGMGKLGAGELNLSSDIDLIFAFPEHGHTQGGRRSFENQEFFIRLGQRLITALDALTPEGFVFRVDMRLRPYGDAGALALSFAAMHEYYQDQGREWERYAMIKARVMAGDFAQGQKLLQGLTPFVYRKYLDYSAIESLREMKALINREVRRKGLADNIKLGSGGIREVEFITQVFQLIRGGRDTELQEASIRKVLPIISGLGLMPADASQELLEAYVFLRNLEHRIQAIADKQTQTLPADSLSQHRLAFSLGFADWDALLTALQGIRTQVRHHFNQIIASPEDEQTSSAAEDESLCRWQQVWQGELDIAQAASFLAEYAYTPAESVLSRLQALRTGKQVQSMQRIGRERLDAFMPKLLEAASSTDKPTQTLERTLMLVEAVLRRTAYFVLLTENPQALTQWVRLCSASPWIAEQLARTPILLDELLDANTLYTPADKAKLADELRQQLARLPEEDMEAQMEALRYFRHAHVLRVAASDIVAGRHLMKVSDYLTYIAEVVLEAVLELAWKHLTSKYGYPQKSPGVPCRPDFIILGYGKLGGIELGYGSDLDLVFIHDGAANLTTDGTRALDNNVFFTRLGQRIIHILNTVTPSGQLYDVDMRLRPSGNSGLLVTSLKAFAEYQAKEAWTWEHQALVRARVICGDPKLAQAFGEIRAATLARHRDLKQLRQDVVEMRQKMRASLGSKSHEHEFNIKQDAGGMVDIEFIVQYSVLAWSEQAPELLQWTDNMRILETLEASGRMLAEDARLLREAYLSYRRAAHRASLQKVPSRIASSEFTHYRSEVQRIWQALLGDNEPC
ncbi:glutamate-ammonia-ligase adenylyltransferase [Allopseudospirillum japonicum]|uniref:Bifunctional glutamine synthetase adenylyltransferase/adenylyl-removing enzyme n=1 Tax=Allopseudospirillum japonicum TaxID=64971 RepID=A0A1H6R5U2_9GAMM|nr:bifunctional [glutamate--ammonia ligase]-adenylyl-L-tyrosine phosphorylase/[glutamate--ammonia-ligase] adenylyltransferase [Allopseudospirillum japonicum]SEI48584.1 glutamate-ammonia-ligase adenylyltransferase [Allopseudospirillum japonicum]